MLDDGTRIQGDWLSNLIDDHTVKQLLRKQAELLTGIAPDPRERPAPNSRRLNRTLHGILVRENHDETREDAPA